MLFSEEHIVYIQICLYLFKDQVTYMNSIFIVLWEALDILLDKYNLNDKNGYENH